MAFFAQFAQFISPFVRPPSGAADARRRSGQKVAAVPLAARYNQPHNTVARYC